jgi:hypothetical protein
MLTDHVTKDMMKETKGFHITELNFNTYVWWQLGVCSLGIMSVFIQFLSTFLDSDTLFTA